MSRILIPTDFSINARNAFEYGCSLLGTDHEYFLFNAYEEPRSTASSMVSLRDILAEASLDSLHEELQYIKTQHPGINISTVSEYGDPVHAVVRYATRIDADLIVMGTAGVTGLQKIFLGSVATAVIEDANCPVIVVPKGYQYETPKNILFTADLKNSDDDRLPEVLTDLIEKNGSEITVLTVNRPGEEIDVEGAEKGYALHMAMNDYAHKFEVISSDDIEVTIRDFARDNEMQMIVTTPRRSSWFQRLLKPSVSKDLAEHLEVPLFAIH